MKYFRAHQTYRGHDLTVSRKVARMLAKRNDGVTFYYGNRTGVFEVRADGGTISERKVSSLSVAMSNPSRRNPTKAQKREKAKKDSAARRIALALAKFLKQANPAMKTAGATVTRLKGGGLTIRPIKAVKRGRR
jgi:hypothetical protein